MESVDRNWYSAESVRHEREIAEGVLKEMKQLEKQYAGTRERMIERTPFGIRVRYKRVALKKEL